MDQRDKFWMGHRFFFAILKYYNNGIILYGLIQKLYNELEGVTLKIN